MVLTASSAAMDLTQVTTSLLDGISQELGLEAKEFKIVLVANKDQIDPKPFQHLFQQHHDSAWEFKPFNAWQNPEPYLEIQPTSSRICARDPSNPSPVTGKAATSLQTVRLPSLPGWKLQFISQCVSFQDDLCDGRKLLGEIKHLVLSSR